MLPWYIVWSWETLSIIEMMEISIDQLRACGMSVNIFQKRTTYILLRSFVSQYCYNVIACKLKNKTSCLFNWFYVLANYDIKWKTNLTLHTSAINALKNACCIWYWSPKLYSEVTYISLFCFVVVYSNTLIASNLFYGSHLPKTETLTIKRNPLIKYNKEIRLNF